MRERFDRLVTLPGNPVTGLSASAWEANLGDVDRDQLLRAVIEAIRRLLLPEWQARRPDDRRPQLALEATEVWIESKTPAAVAHAKAMAKACTAARTETFGYEHRVAEAARAIAWSAGAKDNKHIWDALQVIEEELLLRISIVAEYHRKTEQRRAIVDVLRKALVPEPPAPMLEPASEPTAYSASGAFSVGQRLLHPKFGGLLVSAVGDKWIEVQLDDGSVKRLAQKSR
jgi:immunity protein 5 of polymorphic toxin system